MHTYLLQGNDYETITYPPCKQIVTNIVLFLIPEASYLPQIHNFRLQTAMAFGRMPITHRYRIEALISELIESPSSISCTFLFFLDYFAKKASCW